MRPARAPISARLVFVLLVSGGLALIAAVVLLLGIPGNDGPIEKPSSPRPTSTTVEAIVDVPPLWYRRAVRVTGTAIPVDGERFVLRDAGAAIVVRPQPGAAGDLRSGERVTVSGVVSGLGRPQTTELAALLRSGDHPALRDAPTELEGAYISAEAVAPA